MQFKIKYLTIAATGKMEARNHLFSEAILISWLCSNKNVSDKTVVRFRTQTWESQTAVNNSSITDNNFLKSTRTSRKCFNRI